MTRRQKLLKELRTYAKESGQDITITEGGSHTKVRIGKRTTFIPRHNEIQESLARAIRKKIGANE